MRLIRGQTTLRASDPVFRIVVALIQSGLMLASLTMRA